MAASTTQPTPSVAAIRSSSATSSMNFAVSSGVDSPPRIGTGGLV